MITGCLRRDPEVRRWCGRRNLNASSPGTVSLVTQGSTDNDNWTTLSSQNLNSLGVTFLTPDTGVCWELFRVVLIGPNATTLLGPVWIFRKKL